VSVSEQTVYSNEHQGMTGGLVSHDCYCLIIVNCCVAWHEVERELTRAGRDGMLYFW